MSLKFTDESGLGGEVSNRNRDLFDDVFTNYLDVILKLGRDGNDGSALGHCACRRKNQIMGLRAESNSAFGTQNLNNWQSWIQGL